MCKVSVSLATHGRSTMERKNNRSSDWKAAAAAASDEQDSGISLDFDSVDSSAVATAVNAGVGSLQVTSLRGTLPALSSPTLSLKQPSRPKSSSLPVKSPTSPGVTGGLVALHAALTEIITCGYYHGALSQTEARRVLAGTPEGTFLLRDSSDNRYLLSVSVATPAGVTSIRVAGKPGCFYLDCEDKLRRKFPTFRSPLVLVAYFMLLSRNDGKCFWLDNSGSKQATMKLITPLYKSVPSLRAVAHFALAQGEALKMLKTFKPTPSV